MNQEPTPEDIENGLEAINTPLKDNDSIYKWSQDESNQLLINELLLYREAILREQGESFDKDRLYLDFIKQKKHIAKKARIKKVTYYIIGAAAMIVLALIANNTLLKERYQGNDSIITEYIAQNKPQEITLQVDDQEAIPVKEESIASKPHTPKDKKQTQETVSSSTSSTISGMKLHTYTLSIPRGKSYHLVLDDNTEVWLNADSKLLYPNHFADNERIVELDGEAYFKVAKDAKRPFIVKSKYLTTKVLGTEFNFRAYNNNVGVTLVEGRVAVQQNEGKETVLTPGQNATIVGDELQISDVDVRKFTSWVDGYFYFDEAKLEDIMKELGRWYNINIEFEDKQTKAYEFKFWAKRDDNIEKTINNLNQIGKVLIETDGNKIIIKKKR